MLHEEIAIKTASCAEIGVLDLGVMTESGGSRSGLEALLPARRRLRRGNQRESAYYLTVECSRPTLSVASS
ncbi:hypothetical protein X764_30380 [Mesorhizobium sp. LSHC440A00]|nr:hypothetical protein X764_30380 [Mesorhizobium sp. LSHC440A00]